MSKQKFDYSFLNLVGLKDQFSASEDSIVYLDTVPVPFEFPQCDSACFQS